MATSAWALLKALKMVDLPTLGRPVRPISKPISRLLGHGEGVLRPNPQSIMGLGVQGSRGRGGVLIWNNCAAEMQEKVNSLAFVFQLRSCVGIH